MHIISFVVVCQHFSIINYKGVVKIMLTTSEIREKLKDANLWKVAELAQINPQTLYRFMQGRDIRHVTLEQLSKYLETRP